MRELRFFFSLITATACVGVALRLYQSERNTGVHACIAIVEMRVECPLYKHARLYCEQ
jgi:hypothetical protein